MNGISDLEGIVEAPDPEDADALTVVGLVAERLGKTAGELDRAARWSAGSAGDLAIAAQSAVAAAKDLHELARMLERAAREMGDE